MPRTLEVIPRPHLGAEVQADLARITREDVEAIKAAWYRHDVLVFRDQQLTDDALLEFSQHFGSLDAPPNQGVGRKSPPGYPDVYVVSNVVDEQGEPIGALGYGESTWHTDSSYNVVPPDASLLYALELPPSGGDTSFTSMKTTLAALPPALLERVKNLDIKHDGTYDSGGFLRRGVTASEDPINSPGIWHPLIIEHPVTRQPALYLGRRRNAYLRGLSLEESERVLDEIWSHVGVEVYRHQWRTGDLLLWDNRTLMHCRDAFDPNARRVMHRTQIKGTRAPRRATL